MLCPRLRRGARSVSPRLRSARRRSRLASPSLDAPDGKPLFTDEARFGDAQARRVLFLVSGTHGVEGFCGSGIQTHLVRGGLGQRIPAGVAIVLVHAANPWGFAWLRRVNEDNEVVDRTLAGLGGSSAERSGSGISR